MYAKREKICPAYVSKHNSKRKKQVIILMIPNGGWHYLAVNKLSALLRAIMSDFYFMNCLRSFATENKHESH